MSTYKIETARSGQAVVPDTAFPRARALWVGTAGNVNVRFSQGGSAIYYGVSGRLDVDCDMVIATGTTATNITTMV